MENFNIFEKVSDEEMLKIYKDINNSKEVGNRPQTLDVYARKIKEEYHFETLSQTIDFARELFYQEVAKRYFTKEI